jgi:hypothetical protein
MLGLLGCAGLLLAQNTLPPGGQLPAAIPVVAPFAAFDSPAEKKDAFPFDPSLSSASAGFVPAGALRPNAALLPAEPSPFDGMQRNRGLGSGSLFNAPARPGGSDLLFHWTNRAASVRGSAQTGWTMGGFHGSAGTEFELNQLARGSTDLRLSPAQGTFAFTPRSGLGVGMNAFGTGYGAGSSRAVFSSPTFATGLFDFPGTDALGSGSSMFSTRSGFSAGYTHGKGVGSGTTGFGGQGKVSSPSLTLKLSF